MAGHNSNNNNNKTRQQLIASIPLECISCDACQTPAPSQECRKCHTIHYCSSNCLRALSSHQCLDVEAMRNALIGIGAPVDVSLAKNTTCGICLEEPIADPAVIPDCKHAFCRVCLREWHAMGEKFNRAITCPTCRGVLLFDKSDDNPIERARIYGARANKSSTQAKMRHCNKALEELDALLSRDGSNLQALFTKAEILLIQSKPKDALEVLETILQIDSQNRAKRQTVSNLLDKAEVAHKSGHAFEEERLMKLVEEIGGAKGQHLGNILQDLVDVFLLRADAHMLMEEWYVAKEIYKDLLGLPSGVPKWIVGGVLSTIVLGVIYLLFGRFCDGMVAKITQYVTSAVWGVAILYGLFGRYISSAAGPSKKYTVSSFPQELRKPSVPQQRQCYMKMIKCYYNLQDYDRAIYAGELAVHMNRHYAGVHEYIAKAYKAKGNAEEAKRIMQRAVLYETPWDIENVEKQLMLLEEITAATK